MGWGGICFLEVMGGKEHGRQRDKERGTVTQTKRRRRTMWQRWGEKRNDPGDVWDFSLPPQPESGLALLSRTGCIFTVFRAFTFTVSSDHVPHSLPPWPWDRLRSVLLEHVLICPQGLSLTISNPCLVTVILLHGDQLADFP